MTSIPETYVEVHDDAIEREWRGWKTIDYCDSIEGGEWDQFRVMRSPSGGLFIGYAGGCSCNYFFDSMSPADLTPCENHHDVLAALVAWRDSESWAVESRARGVAELRERILKARPVGHLDGEAR